MKKFLSISLISLLISGFYHFPVFSEEDDHPLISRYPGSVISRKNVKEFNEYKLVVGLSDKNELQGRTLQGKVTRLNYSNPRDRSILEIYKNYENALRKAGMEVLFSCAEEECGPAYAAGAWNRLNGITTKSGSNCRYLAGRLVTEQGEAYVAIMVGKHRHQIDIIEVKAMDSGLVTVDAKALANDIARTGHVSVSGIYFNFGKSDLKPESKAALDEIAKLLHERPNLNLFVVGHTDNVGEFDFNLKLSKDRADAVVTALVRDYNVAVSRLDAHGVGPLAPKATNASDAGRGKNRRVELVAR